MRANRVVCGAVGAFFRILHRVILRVVRGNHPKQAQVTDQNMRRAVLDAVDEAVYTAVDTAVYWAAHGAVDRAVGEALRGSLGGPARRDPPHPALHDFLSAGEGAT